MFLMDYTSIRGEDLSGYDRKSTWKLFHAYIDAHSQRSIDEYPGYGVHAISRLQTLCSNMKFSDQHIYNRLFQQVRHI